MCLTNSLLTALIDAVILQRDALAVMTALRGYGGFYFSTACEVLICVMNNIYPEWAKLAKIPSVIPVSSVLCALTGRWSAYRSEWSGHRLLTGWILYSTGLVCFFTRHTYTHTHTHDTARSPRSSTHSLTSLPHTHTLAHTHTLLESLFLVIANQTFMFFPSIWKLGY